MKNRELKVQWDQFESLEELDNAEANLLLEARKALDKAYAPYSKFHVGAALLLDNGEIVSGANFENAAYTMCLCAERTALASVASMYPNNVVMKIAITVRNVASPVTEPASPCGACRQVMVEVEQKQKADMTVLLQGESGQIFKLASAKTLLPFHFDGSLL